MARFDNNSRSDERHELAPQLELGCQREADRYEDSYLTLPRRLAVKSQSYSQEECHGV